jgi:hypothetical protein
LQDTFVDEVMLEDRAVGCVRLTDWICWQPLASVIVQIYIPAVLPVMEGEVPPEGDHEYVYEPVPPVTLMLAAPLLPPLHEMFDCDVMVEVIAGG